MSYAFGSIVSVKLTVISQLHSILATRDSSGDISGSDEDNSDTESEPEPPHTLQNSETVSQDDEQLAPPVPKIRVQSTITESIASRKGLFAFKGFGVVSQREYDTRKSAAFAQVCED